MHLYNTAAELISAVDRNPALANLLSGMPLYQRSKTISKAWIIQGWIDLPVSRTHLKKQLRKVASLVVVDHPQQNGSYSCKITLNVAYPLILHSVIHELNRYHRQQAYNRNLKDLQKKGQLPQGYPLYPPDRFRFGNHTLYTHVVYNGLRPWQEDRFAPQEAPLPPSMASITHLVPSPKNEKPGT